MGYLSYESGWPLTCTWWTMLQFCSKNLATFGKPGVRSLQLRVPGFLKLFWFARQYVCLRVHPRGH